jgi:glycosyltransferase involved in cell wall biosynthesis
MGSQPSFSVIIANHDYERWVGAAIASVLAQSWDAVECIVVDDGSTDGSRTVIESFDGIRSVFGPNRGQCRAVATGLALATGDVVMILDADDLLEPDACASVAAVWRPDLVAVNFRLAVLDDDRPTGETMPRAPFRSDDPLAHFLTTGGFVTAPTSGNAFARTFVEEVFAVGEGLDGNAVDYWLCLSAALTGPTIAIDRPLGRYRLHTGSVSGYGATRSIGQIQTELVTAHWAQRSAQAVAARHGRRFTALPHVAGPYELKWYLLLRGAPVRRKPLPEIPLFWAVARAITAFAHLDDLSPTRRLANMVQVLAFAVLPWTLRRRLALDHFRLRDDVGL